MSLINFPHVRGLAHNLRLLIDQTVCIVPYRWISIDEFNMISELPLKEDSELFGKDCHTISSGKVKATLLVSKTCDIVSRKRVGLAPTLTLVHNAAQTQILNQTTIDGQRKALDDFDDAYNCQTIYDRVPIW